MPRVREDLGGGLRTGPDPADLGPGELSSMRNAVYKPISDALYRARGRFAFGTVTATASAVNGIRDLQLDNGNHYLVAMAPSAYATAQITGLGVSGAFSPFFTGVMGSQLEAVQYRNRFFLFDGATPASDSSGANVVVYATSVSATCPLAYRQHGMRPVKSVVAITTAAGAFSQTVTGWYEYWTTEVAKLTADDAGFELESSFEGATESVNVTSLSMTPIIRLPEIKNPGFTTHWRIYRSPKKDTQKPSVFPTGFMIAEIPATGVSAVTAQTDTGTATTTDWVAPTTGNSGTTQFGADFANIANAYASGDGLYASGTCSATTQVVRQGFYGYSFPSIVGQVAGVEVQIGAYCTGAGKGNVPVSVAIGPRDSTSLLSGWFRGKAVPRMDGYSDNWVAKSGIIQATAAGGVVASGTLTLGGAADRWWPSTYPGFNASDFNTGFMTMVSFATSAVTMFLDYVKVRVTYGATQDVDSPIQYPTVVYTFGDISSQVSKRSQPPSCSTGDIYEDCLVTNDVLNPSHIKYSFPEEPESFPATYFIDFETRDNDIVRCIRTVNARLLVGLDTSLWRVNYLPSERDASFDRGKAIEPISRTFGIVNPMCACTFSMDGGPEMLAFVSWKGIHMTDGFSVTTLTNDLDWRAILGTATAGGATPIALINDPENLDLIFYYTNTEISEEQCQALHLNYANKHVGLKGTAASHIAGGLLKVSGPVHVRNYHIATSAFADLKSAWAAPLPNGTTKVYLGYGGASTDAGSGKVFVEGGSTIPAKDPTVGFTTRRIFPAGEAGEIRLNELYTYGTFTTAAGSAVVQTWTPLTLKANDANGEVTQGSLAFSLAGQKLYKHQMRQTAGGLRLKHDVTASAVGDTTVQNDAAYEFIVMDYTDFGLEDSGR